MLLCSQWMKYASGNHEVEAVIVLFTINTIDPLGAYVLKLCGFKVLVPKGHYNKHAGEHKGKAAT